jgi:uncharacterized protein (DUF488 family)
MPEFVAALRSAGVTHLVDVRTAPYSRFRPEFSREPLATALDAHGIRYVFMGRELGGKPGGKPDYAQMRLRPAFLEGLARLEAANQAGRRIALMCAEAKPQACHRTKLLAEELVARGTAVRHIDEHGELRSHDEIMQRVTGGQGSLFDRDSLLDPPAPAIPSIPSSSISTPKSNCSFGSLNMCDASATQLG